MADRVLPHSLEAEKSVLGAPMAGAPSLFDVAAGVIGPQHFFRPAHRDIWRAMQSLRDRNTGIDMVTVCEELQRAGRLDAADGPAYVASLTDVMARADNVEHYAHIVREKALLRNLISAANGILEDAYAADEHAEAVLEKAERTVMGVSTAATAGDFILAEDWMRETYAQIEKATTTKRLVTGVPSGLDSLDRLTRGWQPSDLIYLGARPSAGKTSLALQLALEAGKHCMTGFVSMEMSRRVIGMRAVALHASVDAFRLMTGHLTDYEQQRVGKSLNDLGALRMAIDDASGVTPTQLRSRVRRLASRHGLGIVFIDYMQLLRDGTAQENRNQELSLISASLKSLARELDIPIVVLSQLSRTSAKSGAAPQVHDLRDSGSLEQDADVVLLLHRPNQHDEVKRMQDGDPAQLIIAKQRNGPTGSIPLQWVGEQMRFGEAVRP